MFKKSLIMLSLAATLAACGPSQQPPPADQTPPPPVAAAPAAAAPAPDVATAPAPNSNDAEIARLKAQQRKLNHELAEQQAAQRAAEQSAAAVPPPPPPCGDCGVIASITPVQQAGQAGWAGTLGGAAAGGLAGSQFGHGKGKTAMTVVGVLGGAFAGREVQKQVTSSTAYQIVVNMDAGGQRSVTLPAADGLALGTHVHVDGSNLQAY